MSTTAGTEAPTVHILWINAGLSCDGDSVSQLNGRGYAL